MKKTILWGAGGLLALLLVVLGAVGAYLMRAQPQHEGRERSRQKSKAWRSDGIAPTMDENFSAP